MRKHYSVLLAWSIFSFFTPHSLLACGYNWVSDCSSQVSLRINGVLDSFNIASCPNGYNFDGVYLGNVQSVSLANARTITWESCQNNVTSTQVKYRVYEQGFPSGAWNTFFLNEDYHTIEGPYTTRYRSNATDIPLTGSLIVGKTYTIELYLVAEVDTIGDDFIPETTLLRNNNGQNYRLTFTYGGATAPPLLILPHLTEPRCHGGNDGKISVSVYGDLAGLFYHWSNVALNFFQQSSVPAGEYGITVTNTAGASATQSIVLHEPDLVQANFSNIQSVGCNNTPGSATVFGSGGTPPYQYLWQNGQQTATAIFPASGTWQVLVSDSENCTAAGSVTIGNNGLVEQTVNASFCAGTVFTFNGQNFINPGTYSLTLPGTTGCDTLLYLTLNAITPENLLTSLPATASITCTAPQVNLCAMTNPAASYQWLQNGVPVASTPCLLATAGGTYTLNINQEGCSASKSVQVTEHLQANPVYITGLVQSSCNGPIPGWLVAHTNAVTPSFSWVYQGTVLSTTDSCFFQITEFQGLTPVLPALTVTDVYGCQNNTPQANITLIQPSPLLIADMATINASSATTADGSISFDIMGGVSPFAIDWSNGAATPTISNLLPGVYCVTVVDAYACSATACATVNFTMATAEAEAHSILAFPNPASTGQWVQISLPEAISGKPVQLELGSITGHLLLRETLRDTSSPQISFFIPETFPRGILRVRLVSEGQTFSEKILIQ